MQGFCYSMYSMKNKKRKIAFLFGICSLFVSFGLALVLAWPWLLHQDKEYIGREVKIIKPVLQVVAAKQAALRDARVPILMYHHVGDVPDKSDQVRKDLTVDPQDFRAQVAWLYDNGYQSVTLANVLAYMRGRGDLPPKPVVFTFDDGYTDVFLNAVPVLKQYGYVGSFAIITSFPGREGYATWEQIEEAYKDGMEIVSHTQDHFDGSNAKYTKTDILKNLVGSRQDLMEHLGIETEILVYPFGHSTQVYREVAQEAGFAMGLTVRYGTLATAENIYQIPRVRVHRQQRLETFIKNLGKK